MPNAEELLENSDIATWLRSHEGAAERIEKAAKLLADKPDGLKALRQLLPALRDNVVRVFFSYKSKEEDEAAAKAIVRILKKYSAGKLEITYQADFPKEIAGQKWREKIKDGVCAANWFILLLPDPSEDWDWCLYETGLFDREATSADRLICLHHPETDIPSPIADYHHFPATDSKIEEFLRMVYLEDNPVPGLSAINRDLEESIPELASKIVSVIIPKHMEFIALEPYIELKIENAKGLKNRDQLDEAMLSDANTEALNLFGFIERPATWGDLRSEIPEPRGDSRWRDEMFHVVRKIARGLRSFPIQSVFQAKDGRFFRPVAHGIYRVGPSKRISKFLFTFTEDVAAIDSSAIPDELSRLATVLRFAYRFRWEILEKFGNDAMTVDDLERLENAFRRMKKDWESRGIGEESNIMDLFPAEKKQKILEMLVEWGKAKNKEGTGALDIAMANKDIEVISQIIRQLIPMNQEFLELAVLQFSDLITD